MGESIKYTNDSNKVIFSEKHVADVKCEIDTNLVFDNLKGLTNINDLIIYNIYN